MATRWFVEVSALDAEGLKERYCVEAHQWQQALQAARKLRGDAGPLSRFAIEVTDSGHRAIDPAVRLRYVVSKAPPDAELSDGTVPPSSRPVVTPAPTEPSAAPSLAGARLLIERAEEPTDEIPITYREYAFAVAPWATSDELHAMLVSLHRQVVEALAHRGQGKFVQVALFDHIFEGRPQRPPRATLAWKDWRGDPVIKVDEAPTADAAVSGSAETEPVPQTAPAAVTPPRAAAASGAPATAAARPPAPEPLPEPGHRPRLSVDVDRLKFTPTPPRTTPDAIAGPAAAAPTEPSPVRSEATLPGREPTPSEAAPTVPHEVAPDGPSSTRPPTPSEAAPTVRHPEVVATTRTASAPKGPSSTVVVMEPTEQPSSTVVVTEPAGEAEVAAATPAEAVAMTPTGAFPLVEVKVKQGSTDAKGSAAAPTTTPPGATASEPAVPAPQAPASAPQATKAKEPVPEKAEAEPPEAEPPPQPAATAEPVPGSEAAGPAPGPVAPPEPAASPAPTEAASAADAAPASEPLSVRPPPPSHAERRRRGPDEDLITDLFDRMGDLHFIHDLLDGADHVLITLWEMLPCEGTIIHIYDINHEEFVLVRAAGPRPEAAVLLRTPNDAPLFQEALRSGRVVSSDGEDGIDPFLGERWNLLGVEPRHALCAPVLHGGRFLGIIELANPITSEPFREDEVNALLYVCEQLADFVENRPFVLDDELILSQA